MTFGVSYRLAAAIGGGTALFLLWAMGALGIIGVEGDRVDLLYFVVLAIGLGGAIGAGFEPDGMARALLATAVGTMLVGVIALLQGRHHAEYSSLFEILGLTGMFAVPFAVSAWLFRSAGRLRRSEEVSASG